MEGHDQCVLLHPNGLAIVCLSKEHPAVRAAKEGKKLVVDFHVGRQSKADVVPTGKSKTGAVGLQVRSGLCKICIEDEDPFTVRCCVKGRLLEVNKRLIKNPYLLIDHLKKGYIAILETRKKDWESSVNEMGMVMQHKGDPRYV